jgi:prepilin-type N-terminal cleavage/methylation domain-containing protein
MSGQNLTNRRIAGRAGWGVRGHADGRHSRLPAPAPRRVHEARVTAVTLAARGRARIRPVRLRQAGFTLIELMIVVIVIGILASIAIPNYINLRRRAEEGAVKSNMHTLQMSVEDFGLLNDGQYPTGASTMLPDGRNLAQTCPTGDYPKNPYTHIASVVQFNADPPSGNPGELALNPALTTNYVVRGNGWDGSLLPLGLTSGQ